MTRRPAPGGRALTEDDLVEIPAPPLRVLEIGRYPLFVRSLRGEEAHFFSTDPRVDRRSLSRQGIETLGLLQLLALLRSGTLDLVICEPAEYSPLHWRTWTRMIFNPQTLRGRLRPWLLLGLQLLRLKGSTPLAVVDRSDQAYVNRAAFFLMDRADAYFKRELPPDGWRLFTFTGTRGQPTARFRRSRRFQRRLAKVRPLPLGAMLEPAEYPLSETKDIDVFFAGGVDGYPVRERGLEELRQLAAEGYRIDIPAGRLPREEFLARCARALITWSPEGLGWECFRHSEAAMCGSVPLMNRPTIVEHAAFREGEHCLHHGAEAGELAATVRAALQDRPRLLAMGRAARLHACTYRTQPAITGYVIETVLGRRPASRDPSSAPRQSET